MASIGYPEILLAVICFLLLHRLSNSNMLPWNWPLVGMLPWIFRNIQQIQDRCTEVLEQSSGTFLLKGPWFANMDMLITSDPANVHYIMSTNFSNFPKGPEFLKIFDVLGEGIFNSDSDLWRKQRKLAQVLINDRQFQQFLVKTTENKRFTFDTTCKLITGFDTKCLSIEFPRVLFAKAMDDVEEAIFFRHVVPESLWKLQRWLGIGEEKKLSKGWETIDNVIAEYISMKHEELSKGIAKLQEDEEGTDLLTSYMNEDSTMELKSNKFLRDTIVNFLLAGRDTTSAALTWFFWLVSKNPLVEAKIREELKETIPEKDQKWHIFRTEELNKLVYLHGALCETLRLYPPVPFQHKAPHQADVLPSGHRVHPKMKILFSLYAMGRMTTIWGKDCFEFKPERWITEQGGIKYEPSYKFFAFNAGPRTCLGKG
ncbi:Alkane hydroxylase MAH1 [Vitis vinifera]|uniref:Alkane hydroxylase MAH1 n=1 Tax=Vitis vinifera TaxID=29760 RepID=A0A438F6B2_VITVI|nr:Alkane hydroxylase MAH1 [Vitis vinifera]